MLEEAVGPPVQCSCTPCGPDRSGCTVRIYADAIVPLCWVQACFPSEVPREDCAGGRENFLQRFKQQSKRRVRSPFVFICEDRCSTKTNLEIVVSCNIVNYFTSFVILLIQNKILFLDCRKHVQKQTQ